MTKLEQAARQALEALLAATPVKSKDPQMQADAIIALREALESAPQPTRQPLTADEIEQCCYAAHSESKNHPQTWKWTEDFARAIERAIERAHGIGGEA